MIDFNKVDKKELFNHYCNTLEREVDLKHRINKAIEKINWLGKYIEEDEGISWQIEYCDEIVDILKGSDSNEISN